MWRVMGSIPTSCMRKIFFNIVYGNIIYNILSFSIKNMSSVMGFEPTTAGSEVQRAIQLLHTDNHSLRRELNP